MSEARTQGVTGILDAMEEAVASARAMPMSASVIVNRAELLALVSEVRDALPGQLRAADEVIAAADAQRASARADAERIVAEARNHAARLVEAEPVIVEARARAQEILREAKAEAEDLRRDADDYCDQRLASFEIDLGKLLSQVQAGRAKLAGRLGPDR
ncbi:MAG: hypothetical protein FWD18_05020 [Micrococcales bacterium]|nr:hypothetical protein [Micrococcales bacterium]